MTEKWLDLHLFEGDGAGAAPAAGEGAGAEAAAVTPGTTQDGTRIDNRLAARMERLAQKRAARGETSLAGMNQAQATQAPSEPAATEPQEGPNLDDEWAELKKGKFREQYGRDVKSAIDARFKNQSDANQTLKNLQPMLRALAQKNGVDENDLEGLSKVILDDDSLYEEEADKRGMTVEAYKTFKALEDEHNARVAQEQAAAQKAEFDRHFEDLSRQAEELKKRFPQFDLVSELQNPVFMRLTKPGSGLTLEAAYFAVHHNELEPQAMAYGIQRAQQQISQTLQANRSRPTEAAMKGGQPADVSFDPRTLTREQREAIKARVRRGERVTF